MNWRFVQGVHGVWVIYDLRSDTISGGWFRFSLIVILRSMCHCLSVLLNDLCIGFRCVTKWQKMTRLAKMKPKTISSSSPQQVPVHIHLLLVDPNPVPVVVVENPGDERVLELPSQGSR